MDELKELLQTISNQLASIDMKMSVIANSVQPPIPGGGTHWHFGVTGTTSTSPTEPATLTGE